MGVLERCLKDGCFRNGESNVKAQQHQYRAGKERQSPTEGEELFVGERAGKQQKDAAGEKETDGRSELREHAVEGAFVRWSIFDRKEHCAAPFSTEADSLPESAEGKHQWSRDSDRVISGQHTDHEG